MSENEILTMVLLNIISMGETKEVSTETFVVLKYPFNKIDLRKDMYKDKKKAM